MMQAGSPSFSLLQSALTPLTVETAGPFFGRLPRAVIIELILPLLAARDLARISRVCKKFNALASEDSLWDSLAVNLPSIKFDVWPERNLKSFYINQLLNTVLRSQKSHRSKTLDPIFSRFSAATYVALDSCPGISSRGIKSLSDHLTNIITLKVSSVAEGGFKRIKGGALSSLAKAHPELSSLTIYNCPNLSQAEILNIATACPNLTSLELESSELTPALIARIGSSLPKIERLCLTGGEIADPTVQAIASIFKKLQYLYLGKCPKLTRQALETLNLSKSLSECSINQANAEELNSWLKSHQPHFACRVSSN